jgi:hypothetical protein
MRYNNHRKSITLIELIFTIAIISIIVIGSLNFIFSTYRAYNHSKDEVLLEVELKSALRLIENRLAHSVELKIEHNVISWYEVDYRGFRALQWSGYGDINQSTFKNKPNLIYKNNKYLLISSLYRLKSYDNMLFLEKKSLQKDYQNKKYLLLKNISKLQIAKEDEILHIKICIDEDKICSSKDMVLNQIR